jgi:hypothetical protein
MQDGSSAKLIVYQQLLSHNLRDATDPKSCTSSSRWTAVGTMNVNLKMNLVQVHSQQRASAHWQAGGGQQ